MPRLREYVTVGICAGYGDGDYRVSMSIAELSPEDMDKLRQAFCGAITEAERIWRAARPGDQACQAKPRI